MTTAVHPALADAAPVAFWLDRPDAPEPSAPLDTDAECDLVVVGGGYTGLWTALLAKERDPARDVLVLEQRECGWAASGRNGGFCASSLTHGLANGIQRFPDEIAELDRLGRENLDAIERAVTMYGIECDFRRSGELEVATRAHQLAWLHDDLDEARRFGHAVTFLDADALRAEIVSPLYLAANFYPERTALVDPARLAWGLRRACLDRGVRFAEHTPVSALAPSGAGVELRARDHRVRARHAVLATNAFPALLRRLRPYTVPVYDYALMSEPLSAEQRDAIGWRNGQGIGEVANQFHYSRMTDDGRILWGGYDAIYHWRNGLRDELDVRPATFELLARQFFETFPQLRGVRFTHAWGGAIDTSTRFFAFQGTALEGRLAYSLGYTGLGVAASRFGAVVMLDLLDGRESAATRVSAPRRKPVPFPPEPLRWAGIQVTRRALARADANDGRRGFWLRALDRLGMGFDS